MEGRQCASLVIAGRRFGLSLRKSMKKKKKVSSKPSGILTGFVPAASDLVFVPLGGTCEIGMNCALLGHDGEWLMIDCGLSFYDRLGVELLTADPTFIVQQRDRLKALLITHAHEDHIGAVEYLWPLLKCPVYAAPFAAAVLRQKIQNKSWKDELDLHEVAFKGTTDIGKFNVEFVNMTHSIPDPSCVVVRTPLGTIVHTGDWKFDATPVIGKKADEKRLKKIGDEGVLAYLSDSTNIFTKEEPDSEKHVRECLTRLVESYSGKRIIFACFSSNIARLETAILAAHQAGRKVAIVGRSLQRMMAAAKETGYMKKVPELVDKEEAASMPPGKVMLICTGSQGESRSALVQIAQGKDPVLQLGEDDVVLFSSRVIPGNEKSIGALHSLLAKAGADIVTSSEENIHTSGHPARKAIKKMYDILRPKIVIPVHGEARHLVAQSHFAKEQGILQVVTPTDGTLLQLAGESPEVLGQVEHGVWAVDGKRMISFDGATLKERMRLSEEGSVFITVLVCSEGVKEISVDMRGLLDPGILYKGLQDHVKQAVLHLFEGAQGIRENETNSAAITQRVRQVVKQKLGKDPVTNVHIMEVGG